MLSAPFITHVTAAGERWDLLAWKFYGDPAEYNPIIFANPAVPIEPVLDQGLTIVIPVSQVSNAITQNLPPWKAGTPAN